MMLLALLLLDAVSFVFAQSVGTFFNPPAAVKNQPDFSTNPVWTVGETEAIQWTTTYLNYTIALWQQILDEDAALRGPSIFAIFATLPLWILRTN
jgi:hypothetical protein